METTKKAPLSRYTAPARIVFVTSLAAIGGVSGCSMDDERKTSATASNTEHGRGPVVRRRDFQWKAVPESRRFRRQIVAAANWMVQNDPRCGSLDPKSLSAVKPFTKAKPRFIVACRDAQGRTQSALIDIRANERLAEAAATRVPLSEDDAMLGCERVAKTASRHPYTVEFSRVYDATYMPEDDGRVHFTSTFTAQNSFGVRDQYRIHCYFQGPRLVRFNVTDAAV